MTDASDVQRLAGAKEIADMTCNIPHPYEDGMAEEWIGRHAETFAKREGVTLAITLADTGELIGAISLMDISDCHHHAEIGYWIGMPWWGSGYCTEAAREMVRFGFEDLGLHRIYGHHLVRNPASGRVMTKIGMTHEGTLREHIRKGDTFHDIEVYGIVASDWGESS